MFHSKGPIASLVFRASLTFAVIMLNLLAECADADEPTTSQLIDQPSKITNQWDMEFVRIPAGSFMMGVDTVGNANPAHVVEISHSLYLESTEVSEWPFLYAATSQGVIPVEAKAFPKSFDSWNDAVNFAEVLTEQDPRFKYRLPTEAEWEYACRANGKPQMEELKTEQTHPGSRYQLRVVEPNGFGLYDMLRSNGEYCSDWYAEDYYQNSPRVNPQGPESSKLNLKVVRGLGAKFGRASCSRRDFTNANGEERMDIGLRLVLEFKDQKSDSQSVENQQILSK